MARVSALFSTGYQLFNGQSRGDSSFQSSSVKGNISQHGLKTGGSWGSWENSRIQPFGHCLYWKLGKLYYNCCGTTGTGTMNHRRSAFFPPLDCRSYRHFPRLVSYWKAFFQVRWPWPRSGSLGLDFDGIESVEPIALQRPTPCQKIND